MLFTHNLTHTCDEHIILLVLVIIQCTNLYQVLLISLLLKAKCLIFKPGIKNGCLYIEPRTRPIDCLTASISFSDILVSVYMLCQHVCMYGSLAKYIFTYKHTHTYIRSGCCCSNVNYGFVSVNVGYEAAPHCRYVTSEGLSECATPRRATHWDTQCLSQRQCTHSGCIGLQLLGNRLRIWSKRRQMEEVTETVKEAARKTRRP